MQVSQIFQLRLRPWINCLFLGYIFLYCISCHKRPTVSKTYCVVDPFGEDTVEEFESGKLSLRDLRGKCLITDFSDVVTVSPLNSDFKWLRRKVTVNNSSNTPIGYLLRMGNSLPDFSPSFEFNQSPEAEIEIEPGEYFALNLLGIIAKEKNSHCVVRFNEERSLIKFIVTKEYFDSQSDILESLIEPDSGNQ